MSKGVFLTDRGIFEKKLWQNVLDFRLFFFLYGNAVWNEEGVQVGEILVGRGQFLRSYRQLQDDLTYIENNKKLKPPLESVRRSIRRLELDGRLRTACTEHGTLFIITNYQYYQGFERFYSIGLETGLGTGLGQALDNNKKDIKKKEKNTYVPAFVSFWSVYPRKKEKDAAYKTWQTRLKEGVKPQDMLLAAERYAQECQINETEERFIKHPKTFLGPSKPFAEYLSPDWRPPSPPYRSRGQPKPERGLPVL